MIVFDSSNINKPVFEILKVFTVVQYNRGLFILWNCAAVAITVSHKPRRHALFYSSVSLFFLGEVRINSSTAYNPFTAQWLLSVPPVLTLKRGTFCPQRVCDLFGSVNKRRLFPYTALIGWLFIIETECVYWAVQAVSFNMIEVNPLTPNDL
jgi:hypothetical protein